MTVAALTSLIQICKGVAEAPKECHTSHYLLSVSGEDVIISLGEDESKTVIPS